MVYTSEQHKEALKLFDPAKGYAVDNYYGVSIIKLKKNNKYSIKLMYGYSQSGKNSVMSEGVIVDKPEDAIQLYTLLEQFAKDGETKSEKLDFLNKSEPSIVENAFDGSEKVDNNIISKDDELEQVLHTGDNAFD